MLKVEVCGVGVLKFFVLLHSYQILVRLIAMGAYALLRWIEEPPKWDIVPARDINGPLEEGARVEAKFEGDLFPAVVVKLGKLLFVRSYQSFTIVMLLVLDPVECTRQGNDVFKFRI